MGVVLTLDLGTSATKAALWTDHGLAAIARAPLATHHPEPGWAEQDPRAWWASVRDACAQLRAERPDLSAGVDAIGFAAARESFALLDERLEPIGPGILWSDQRAGAEAAGLGDPVAFRARTGVVGNGASHAAKVLWVNVHDRDRLDEARWIVAPRDAVVAWMTGRVVTDTTLASRTGWYPLAADPADAGAREGWTEQAREVLGDRLPPVEPPTTVAGPLIASAADELGLPHDALVVLGGGDRACEALGVGATRARPTVSWGTTTNVSAPHPGPVGALPSVATVSRAAGAEPFLLEVGISAGGAALEWLASLTGRPREVLLAEAAMVPAGARGVLALPWLHGARGPWWRSDAHAAFLGLTAAHGPPELARALVEAVALDVARAAELLGLGADGTALAGAGAASPVWREVLAGATGRPWERRAHVDAASVGARLVVAAARGESLSLDDVDPVVDTGEPDPALVAAYGPVRAASDRAAAALLASAPAQHPPSASAGPGVPRPAK